VLNSSSHHYAFNSIHLHVHHPPLPIDNILLPIASLGHREPEPRLPRPLSRFVFCRIKGCRFDRHGLCDRLLLLSILFPLAPTTLPTRRRDIFTEPTAIEFTDACDCQERICRWRAIHKCDEQKERCTVINARPAWRAIIAVYQLRPTGCIMTQRGQNRFKCANQSITSLHSGLTLTIACRTARLMSSHHLRQTLT
jgi:hypothetical protein